jgi:hypothetical protein
VSDEEVTPKKVAAKKVVPVKKQKVATYVGGMEGIVVHLPSGRILTFERNETHPIMASETQALAAHPEFDLADAKEENTQ